MMLNNFYVRELFKKTFFCRLLYFANNDLPPSGEDMPYDEMMNKNNYNWRNYYSSIVLKKSHSTAAN